MGALDSILRTQGSFLIQSLGSQTGPLALQVARNLYQYFGADSNIVSDLKSSDSWKGNVMSLFIGHRDAPVLDSHPIMITEAGISITRGNRVVTFLAEPGLGAIFLTPRLEEGLELCIWGNDEQGLRQAARLVPMLTGVGQPDFVVLGRESRWEGVAGAKAMGFFDYEWKVSEASCLA